MIINGFGGGNSSTGSADPSALLAATDSQGVYTALYFPKTGVGAMLADICISEGCATASTSGLSTLQGLNTYAEVIANSTAFGIVNKSGCIWNRVNLNNEARTAWQSALPSTYTFPATTFTKVANSDVYYIYGGDATTRTLSVPSGKIVQCVDSNGSQAAYSGYGLARFTVNTRWPRGYTYASFTTAYSNVSNAQSVKYFMSTLDVTLSGYQAYNNIKQYFVSSSGADNLQIGLTTTASSSATSPATTKTTMLTSAFLNYNPLNNIILNTSNIVNIGIVSDATGNRNWVLNSLVLSLT